MPNGLPDGAELAYYVKGQVVYYIYLLSLHYCFQCLTRLMCVSETTWRLQAGKWHSLWLLR